MAEGLELMESACPSLLCLLVLPSLHSVLSFFLLYQALGKAGASQAPSRAPLGGRQLGADVSVSGAGSSAIPSLHLTPAAPVGGGPSPSMGEATKDSFERLETFGVLRIH